MTEDPADLALAQTEPKTLAGREAAGRVLEAHRGLIVQICEQMLMDGYEIDDMIQEANIAALEAIKYYRLDRGFQFSTYMADCIRRRVNKWRNSRKQRPLPQEGGEQSLDLLSNPPAPVDPEWMASVMECLTPLERLALSLKYGIDGPAIEDKEISKRLGVTKSAVNTILFRGRNKLEAKLNEGSS